jgi:hypothetical protein
MFLVQSEPRDVGSAPTGRYLAALPGNPNEMMMRHVPALVVPQRHAFIATLFAVPGQHPIKILSPFASLSATAPIPDVHFLDEPPGSAAQPYLRDWDKRFDYVLAIGMDSEDLSGRFEPPPNVQLVSDQGYARLFRVVR